VVAQQGCNEWAMMVNGDGQRRWVKTVFVLAEGNLITDSDWALNTHPGGGVAKW
jgi:hypothetical protein